MYIYVYMYTLVIFDVSKCIRRLIKSVNNRTAGWSLPRPEFQEGYGKCIALRGGVMEQTFKCSEETWQLPVLFTWQEIEIRLNLVLDAAIVPVRIE